MNRNRINFIGHVCVHIQGMYGLALIVQSSENNLRERNKHTVHSHVHAALHTQLNKIQEESCKYIELHQKC